MTTTSSPFSFGVPSRDTSSEISASFSSIVGSAFVGVTLTPSPRTSTTSASASSASATLSGVPSGSVSRPSAVFTCPDDDGTYYTDQSGNGYQIQCNTNGGSQKRAIPQDGLYGFALNHEPVMRATISSNLQPDFASCVNSCRNVGGCIGTSYVISTGLCAYFSTFTTVNANTGTNVAFPVNITCPNLNGLSYLDSSGSEYDIPSEQQYHHW
ncbi:hypothetical protein E4T39_01496 [Aureobasidium subglaciale]|nr:hypothetical protein E4T39_01496 [Aureobasidium subglaciale]